MTTSQVVSRCLGPMIGAQRLVVVDDVPAAVARHDEERAVTSVAEIGTMLLPGDYHFDNVKGKATYRNFWHKDFKLCE